MSIKYDKISDYEKEQLRDLKRDLDDGVLNQRQYNKIRKKIERDIEIRQNKEMWSLLPKPIWALIFLGIFAVGFYIISSMINNKPEQISIQSTNLRAYGSGKVMVEFKIINHKSITIDAECRISVSDKNKVSLASDTYNYTSIPANSSKSVMAQISVKPGMEQSISYHVIDCFVKR